MFEPKVPAIGAAIGFALSFIVGILSGAAFGAILLRAILMAVLFAGLAFGCRFLIQNYLPELTGAERDMPTMPDDQGTMVDITLGGQERDVNPFDTGRTQSGDDMVPDFLRNSSMAGNETASAVGSTADIPTGTGKASSLASSVADRSDSAGASERPKTTVGGLDVLPDLEDFVPRANEEPSDDEEEVVRGTGLSGHESLFDASESKGSGAETETMAKAIRTILTRDS